MSYSDLLKVGVFKEYRAYSTVLLACAIHVAAALPRTEKKVKGFGVNHAKRHRYKQSVRVSSTASVSVVEIMHDIWLNTMHSVL